MLNAITQSAAGNTQSPGQNTQTGFHWTERGKRERWTGRLMGKKEGGGGKEEEKTTGEGRRNGGMGGDRDAIRNG